MYKNQLLGKIHFNLSKSPQRPGTKRYPLQISCYCGDDISCAEPFFFFFKKQGLLWKLPLGNTNPAWALLKRCWVKFQVSCPWTPISGWILGFSLSWFQLSVSSIRRHDKSPKRHTNKYCEVLYSYADSQRRHASQTHHWWKTIRATQVRKPHITLSL